MNLTTRGPSAELWQTHRDEITDMYLRKSLSCMMKHMERNYGFRASKRMFDARFKSWGVQKNLRRADKERLISGMTKATSVSENDMKKVKRYLSAQHRRSRSKSISSSTEEGDGQSLSENSSPYSLEGHTPSSTGQSTTNRSPSLEAISSSRPVQRYPQRHNSYNPVGVQIPLPSDGLQCLSLTAAVPYGDFSSDYLTEDYIPMERPLSMSVADSNVELLWMTMNHFISVKIQCTSPEMLPYMSLNNGTTDVSRSFWDRVENSIYQFKIGDNEGLAVPAFEDAKGLLEYMFDGRQVSLDFLRKVLYTLSPTNTAMCSETRTELMKLIREYAAKGLGVDYPITKVCAILLADEEDSDLSRRALNKMYEMISTGLGKRGASHPASCKVMDSVITLARRTGEQELRRSSKPSVTRRQRGLATAMSLAEQAYKLAIHDHGSESDQSRQAAYTLAELCTVTSDHARAHQLRLKIIQQDPCDQFGALPSVKCEDAISVYTMESIAEHREKEDDYQGSTIWLARAESIASKIWDQSNVSRTHISNKLQNAYARFGESLITSC